MQLSRALVAIAPGISISSAGLARGMPLAKDCAETHTEIHLTVTSSSIQPDAPIPAKYSAYVDGIARFASAVVKQTFH
jgi:hypothetical protein